jgi:hypothetical protein
MTKLLGIQSLAVETGDDCESRETSIVPWPQIGRVAINHFVLPFATRTITPSAPTFLIHGRPAHPRGYAARRNYKASEKVSAHGDAREDAEKSSRSLRLSAEASQKSALTSKPQGGIAQLEAKAAHKTPRQVLASQLGNPFGHRGKASLTPNDRGCARSPVPNQPYAKGTQ